METTSAAEQVGIADQADAAGFGIVCVCVSAKGPSALERLFKTVPSLGPAAFDEICWGVNDLVIGRRKSVSALRPTALAARWTLLSERVSA
jgi:hypothetical protein